MGAGNGDQRSGGAGGRTTGAREEGDEDLRHEAEVRRAAVKRTAAALEDRLRARSEQIGVAIDRTRDRLHEVDRLAHRYRYALIGAAVGVGFGMARRSRPRPPIAPRGGDGVRYVLVERPPQRQGLVRSVLGGVAALALRQGVNWVGHWLAEQEDREEEPLLLPPAKR